MADAPELVTLRVDVGMLKQSVADQKQELQSLAQEFHALRRQVWGLIVTTLVGPTVAALLLHHL